MLLVVITACRERTSTVTDEQRAAADPRIGAFLIEGQRAFQRGDYQTALVWADSAEAHAPGLTDMHFLRGLVYSALKRYDQAAVAYERVLATDPQYQGAHYNLGLNAVRQGKLQNAINHFAKEKATYPTSALYLELGRTYAQLGEADSAKTAYWQALALDTTNATAHLWLGQLHEDLGELDSALVHSQAGLNLRPQNLDYRYIVGTQLYRLGQLEEAAAHLRPVAEEQAWHHGAQYNLSQVLLRLGRREEAERYQQRAEEAQGLLQEVDNAEEATQRAPNNLQYWLDLSSAYRRAGRLDEAIDAYQVAATLDPSNLYLQNNLANLLHADGRFREALYHYQAILRIDSTLPDVWLNLGVVYANLDSTAAARSAWQRVLSYRPSDATASEYLEKLKP
ncbi:MAG: tetratricopeptide repeat protein [Rhodothermales bacterium]